MIRARLAGVAIAITAVGAAGHAAFDGAEAASAKAWTESATAAAAAVVERAPRGSGVPRATTCAEAKERVVALLTRTELASDEALDATTLGSDVVSLTTERGACVDDVLPMLGAAPTCGAGYAAIVSGVISTAATPTGGIERLASSAAPECASAILLALSTGAHASRALVEFAEGELDAPDEVRRTSAWLALGTLGRMARANDPEVGDRVDRRLEAALADAADADRVLRLESAGNAACAACLPQIDRAGRAPSWDVRRAAVAAWRFQARAGAAAAMCRPLLVDTSAAVRESAAWAMQWRHEEDAERVDCLVTAAATDSAPAVRRAATRSLVALAETSSDARSALVHLTGDAYAPEVRQMATDYAMTTELPVAVFNSSGGGLPWAE